MVLAVNFDADGFTGCPVIKDKQAGAAGMYLVVDHEAVGVPRAMSSSRTSATISQT